MAFLLVNVINNFNDIIFRIAHENLYVHDRITLNTILKYINKKMRNLTRLLSTFCIEQQHKVFQADLDFCVAPLAHKSNPCLLEQLYGCLERFPD